MQLSRFHAQNRCHARVLAHRLSPLPHGLHTVATFNLQKHRQLHTFMQNHGFRTGVVKIDVPEHERGIDFKYKTLTVTWFSMVFAIHVHHSNRKTATVAHFYIKPSNPCGSGENGHRKPRNCRVFMLKIDATLAFWHTDCHHSHTDCTRLRRSTFKNTDSCTLLCKTMDSVREW